MTPADGPLTVDRVLVATEDVLRRYGPAKATVADVARVLQVSPGSIYRHFPSRTALREAVTRDWLVRTHAGLEEVATGPGSAPDRLTRWLDTLYAAKKRHAREDPQLFDTYEELVRESSSVVSEHVSDLLAQLERIVRDGAADGSFASSDPALTARTVFSATARFHDPLHVREWRTDGGEQELAAVRDLLLTALTALTAPASRTGSAPRGAPPT